jgi:hypothetical protein
MVYCGCLAVKHCIRAPLGLKGMRQRRAVSRKRLGGWTQALHCPDKSERLYLLPLMRTALRRPSRQAGEGGQTHCETDALKGPSTMKGLAFWKGPDWLRFVGQALQYARESAAAAPFCVA